MTFKASIITLYPDMFPGPLNAALAGKALENGAITLETINPRDFATDRHKSVDDTPSGGGAGMVMRADILAKTVDHASPKNDTRPRLMMSPRGKPLNQARVRELALGQGAVILCGRFEGIDERLIQSRNFEEISIGDYVLSGGEMAALTLLDAITRILPGVMGNETSGITESFETGLLEHPHYTRPADFEGMTIPDILTSGNHAKIETWRHEKSLAITRQRRPDLLPAYFMKKMRNER